MSVLQPSASALKQAKKSVKAKQTVVVVAGVPASPVVPEPARLTTEEVMEVEMEVDDSNDAGIYQATLAFRGKEVQPAIYLDENFFYNWAA